MTDWELSPSVWLSIRWCEPRRMSLDDALRFLPQAIVSGLEAGVLYALPALAFILIYRASDVMNFAQGEMSMFSTFVALSILNRGMPLPIAFLGPLLCGPGLGT